MSFRRIVNGEEIVDNTRGIVIEEADIESGVVRNIYTSTSAPSGGMDGDVWLVYS